jgi:hypothetical protein
MFSLSSTVLRSRDSDQTTLLSDLHASKVGSQGPPYNWSPWDKNNDNAPTFLPTETLSATASKICPKFIGLPPSADFIQIISFPCPSAELTSSCHSTSILCGISSETHSLRKLSLYLCFSNDRPVKTSSKARRPGVSYWNTMHLGTTSHLRNLRSKSTVRRIAKMGRWQRVSEVSIEFFKPRQVRRTFMNRPPELTLRRIVSRRSRELKTLDTALRFECEDVMGWKVILLSFLSS